MSSETGWVQKMTEILVVQDDCTVICPHKHLLSGSLFFLRSYQRKIYTVSMLGSKRKRKRKLAAGTSMEGTIRTD